MYRWYHTVVVFLCLTQYKVIKAHSCCCKCHDTLLFHGWIIFYCISCKLLFTLKEIILGLEKVKYCKPTFLRCWEWESKRVNKKYVVRSHLHLLFICPEYWEMIVPKTYFDIRINLLCWYIRYRVERNVTNPR